MYDDGDLSDDGSDELEDDSGDNFSDDKDNFSEDKDVDFEAKEELEESSNEEGLYDDGDLSDDGSDELVDDSGNDRNETNDNDFEDNKLNDNSKKDVSQDQFEKDLVKEMKKSLRKYDIEQKAIKNGYLTTNGYVVASGMKNVGKTISHKGIPQEIKKNFQDSVDVLGRHYDLNNAINNPEEIITIYENNVPQEIVDKNTLVIDDITSYDNYLKMNVENDCVTELINDRILSDDGSNELLDTNIETNSFNQLDDVAENITTEAKEFNDLKNEYFNDLKSRSKYPDTINDSIKENDWKKITTEETGEMREEFGISKNRLISDWELQNNKKWPTYEEDIYSQNGNLIRRAGDKYDAHHIQPLTYDGKNIVENITPLHALEHFDKQGVHSPNSPFGKMKKLD